MHTFEENYDYLPAASLSQSKETVTNSIRDEIPNAKKSQNELRSPSIGTCTLLIIAFIYASVMVMYMIFIQNKID
jgi:hypothetical protein